MRRQILAVAALAALGPPDAFAREPEAQRIPAPKASAARPLALTPARFVEDENAVTCADFARWEDAQSFYDSAAPTDPYGLDPDSDGVACERLRGGRDE